MTCSHNERFIMTSEVKISHNCRFYLIVPTALETNTMVKEIRFMFFNFFNCLCASGVIVKIFFYLKIN